MPIVFQRPIAGGHLALWQITDSEAELRALVTADDLASIAAMSSAGRRRERLAWRAMLRELLPGAGAVSYDAAGAPTIQNGFIGVSHCAGWAALIYRRGEKCAIDIEPADRDVRAAAARMGLAEASVEAWCASEARHKYGGDGQVNCLWVHGLCVAYI